MSESMEPKSAHTLYEDGTYESICTEYISMAGLTDDDEELSFHESVHASAIDTQSWTNHRRSLGDRPRFDL
jgi:hypothetical protein